MNPTKPRSCRTSRLATLCAVVLSASLAMGVSGCAAEAGFSSTPDPVTSTEPTTGCPLADGDYGDVIPDRLVSDEYGEYCKMKLDPASPAAQLDSSIVDVESLTTYGYTMEDAKEVYDLVVNFIATQMFDSTALDSQDPDAFKTWWEDGNYKSMFKSELLDDAVMKEILGNPHLVYSGELAVLNRDGHPRAHVNILASAVKGQPSKSGAPGGSISVRGNAWAYFRMDDTAAIQHVLSQADFEGWTAEQLIVDYPQLNDGIPNIVEVGSFFNFTYEKGSSNDWVSNGYGIRYDPTAPRNVSE